MSSTRFNLPKRRLRLGFAIFGAIALTLGVILGSATVTHAQKVSGSHPERTTYTFPGDNIFPEGISNVTEDGTFYVGSAFTGAIYRGHVGQPDLSVFLPAGRDGRVSVGGLKVDRAGRLYVCGAFSTFVFVYDTHTGKLLAKFDTGNPAAGDLVNDVALAPNGDAYITDSISEVLYRIPLAAVQHGSGQVQSLQPWLSLPQFGAHEFLNGIVVTEDGRKLIVAAEDVGEQILVDVTTKQAQAIDLGGQPVPGDGLLLRGNTLYSMDSADKSLIKVQLAPDLQQGTVISRTAYPQLLFPTTMAFSHDDMLVVNAQIDKEVYYDPQLGHEALRQIPLAHTVPFTVSLIETP